MDDDHKLSLAFMRSHPAQAAQVLEALPAEEAAEIFASAPARLGSDVMANMLPYLAANCLARLDDQRVLELLSSMGAQHGVSLLRHVAEPRRSRLTTDLPTTTAVAASLLLGYAEDTVGAWIDPDAIVFPPDTSVSHVLDRIRQSDVVHSSRVFVVDEMQRLIGAINIGQLLKSPDETALAAMMQPIDHMLIAQAPLSAANVHLGWEVDSVLPVVERDGRLLGVMSRESLTRALRRSSPATEGVLEETSLSGLLALGYWHAISGILEGGLMLLPKVRPLMEKRHGD